MTLSPQKVTKTYRFQLRGIHSLNMINEPTHGHGAELLVTLLCPLMNEREFLTSMKMNVLNLFHKKDWKEAVPLEPTGENVLQMIWKIVMSAKIQDHIEKIELVETRKNRFIILPK